MKKISQRLLAAAVVVAAGASASAEVLSPEEALGRALPQARHAAPALTQPVLAYTAEADELPAVYVFAKENKGYLVIAADDAVTPLLGYTDKGNFDADNMAPALRYWLNEYAREIAYARQNGVVEAPAQLARPERNAIAPLVKTQWDQTLPYNLLTPIQTVQGNQYRTPTGCVATAAAQVMKFYQHPQKNGTGKFSCPGGSALTPQVDEINLAEWDIQWDKMLDTYNSASPEENQLAVAELMLAVGYGVNMTYTAQASGAQTVKVGGILAENFGYDKSVTYLQRNCYSLAQWEEIIYNELAANRVVIYDGNALDLGGHAFVCDGYDKDGYFHFNWGWGGVSDGYFLVGMLNPSTQGTGGAGDGEAFNFSQDITVNIMPDQGGSAVPSMTAQGSGLVIAGNTAGQFNLGREVTVSYEGGGFFNHNWNTITPKYGLHIVGSGKDIYRWSSSAATETAPNIGRASYTVLLSGVEANSTYVLTPAFKVGDQIYEIGLPYGQTRSYMLTTQTSTGILTPIANNLTVADMQVPAEFKFRDRFELKASLVNESDAFYYGHITPAYFQKVYGEYEIFKTFPTFTLNLEPGESQEWTKSERYATASASGFELGKDYYFGFMSLDESGNATIVSELKKIRCVQQTGINDVTTDNATIAVITPNPADSYFTVQGVEVSSVKVYSIAGNLVAAAAEATVNVADLAAGLYLVEIVDVDGNHTTARLIKK